MGGWVGGWVGCSEGKWGAAFPVCATAMPQPCPNPHPHPHPTHAPPHAVCAGAEGAVYAAWFLESPVAVKKFERVESSLHEVEMYLRLGSHDNIVALR